MNYKRDIAIEIKGISKVYQLRDHVPFEALRDISFTIHKGDVVGIIGSNGSGKSTLLKILSQITKPTRGSVDFYGTVTSILDIGSNFYPDFSGRENVKIQLRINKVPAHLHSSYYDKILAFSEIGEFFEQPVKHYSSGMFLRLAFSVAFNLATDVLILDEVLSVGDEGFRLKCQDLLRSFVTSGRTILFVSHNRNEILELCNQCVWLDAGTIRKIGIPHQVLSEYFEMHRDNYDMNLSAIKGTEPNERELDKGIIHKEWAQNQEPGNAIMTVKSISVLPIEGQEILKNDEPILISMLIDKMRDNIHIGAFFFIQDVFYQPVLVGYLLNYSSKIDPRDFYTYRGLIKLTATLPSMQLIPGKYYISFRFGTEEQEWTASSTEGFRIMDNLSFTVHPSPDYLDYVGDASKGSIRPALDWQVQKLS